MGVIGYEKAILPVCITFVDQSDTRVAGRDER